MASFHQRICFEVTLILTIGACQSSANHRSPAAQQNPGPSNSPTPISTSTPVPIIQNITTPGTSIVCPTLAANFACIAACNSIRSLAQAGCPNGQVVSGNENAAYLLQFMELVRNQAGSEAAQTACVRLCDTKQLPQTQSLTQSRRIWNCFQNAAASNNCVALANCTPQQCP